MGKGICMASDRDYTIQSYVSGWLFTIMKLVAFGVNMLLKVQL